MPKYKKKSADHRNRDKRLKRQNQSATGTSESTFQSTASHDHETDQSSVDQPTGKVPHEIPHSATSALWQKADHKTPKRSTSSYFYDADKKTLKSAASLHRHQTDPSSLYQPAGYPIPHSTTTAPCQKADHRTSLSSTSSHYAEHRILNSPATDHRTVKSAASLHCHKTRQSSLYQPTGKISDQIPHSTTSTPSQKADYRTLLSSKSSLPHDAGHRTNKSSTTDHKTRKSVTTDHITCISPCTDNRSHKSATSPHHHETDQSSLYQPSSRASDLTPHSSLCQQESDNRNLQSSSTDQITHKSATCPHDHHADHIICNSYTTSDCYQAAESSHQRTEENLTDWFQNYLDQQDMFHQQTKISRKRTAEITKDVANIKKRKIASREALRKKIARSKQSNTVILVRERDAKRKRERRKDKIYRTTEQKKDTERHVMMRKDSAFKNVEKERETKLRTEKRKDKTYRAAEQEKDTDRHVMVRKDSAFKTREKERESKLRIEKRKDQSYRTAEQEKDTERHVMVRKDSVFKNREKERESKLRTEKRKDQSYRTAEQEKDTERHVKIRKDTAFKNREKERESKLRTEKRKDKSYRTAEQEKNTERHMMVRKDSAFKNREKERESKLRTEKRKDKSYRTAEQEKDTERHVKIRKDIAFKNREKERESKLRTEKRKDKSYRTAEQEKDTERHVKIRKDTAFKNREKERESKLRTEKRKDKSYRTAEQEKNTERHVKIRKDSAFKTREKERESKLRTEKRKDKTYRKAEQKKNTKLRSAKRQQTYFRTREREREKLSKSKQRQLKSPQTLHDVIEAFHCKVSEGPIYICTSCSQLWFKHSVLAFPKTLKKSEDQNIKELIQSCPMNIGIHGKLWLCKTCFSYLKRGKMPPMSRMNKMEFPASCILQELNPLEQTLLAVILPFMKIHQAPRGKQKKLLGNMVLVPSDVDSTVTQLPRLQSNTGTIKAKLKRRLRYKHHVYALNIRPHLVRSAAKYLTSAPLYKQYVQFDDSWSEEIHEDESSEEEEDNEQHASSDKKRNKDKVTGSDEEWDEVDDGEKMSGEADTMLSAPDYIEPGERDKVYNFAPAEGGAPLSVFLQPDCEELAFPGIFCGHKRPSNNERTVRVTYSDIVKSELRNADRRAASNIENLFFKAKKMQMKTLIDQGQLALRKVKVQDQHLTVKDVTGESAKSLIFHDKAYKFLANIRGSPPYFEKASKDLFAMIRQLGPATFFITLSAAESRWLHLLRILGAVVDHRKYTDQELTDMTWDEKCRLIQSDPITCARVFDHSVSAFLSTFVHSECHPLSEVQDFFYRVEYQQRGSPHIHMMIWCKDSPTFGKDSDEDICEFIDKFITCNSITDNAKLTELIVLQNHRHSHTCKKKREKVCRFGFPKPPLEKTTILYPLDADMPRKIKEELRKKHKCIQTFLNEHEDDLDITYKEFLDLLEMTEEEYVKAIRSTLKSPTVFLKRKVCEPRMNNYNNSILLAWRANIDIQFVLDVYACATYVASYVTKSQRGMSELLRRASQEVKTGNLTLKEQIRTVGNKFLNAVEISAQEAAYICLQLPMKRASRKVVFVNTSPPSSRVSLLKSQAILNKMQEDDDDIECSNDLTRYATRPTSMENLCLAEFISQYDRISKDNKQHQTSTAKNINLFESSEIINDDEHEDTDLEEEAEISSDQQYRKRKIGNILRPVHFNPDTDTELYYRELIVLYHPWRDENALKEEDESFQQKYFTLKDEISKVREIYEPFAAAVDEASRLILEMDNIDESWDQFAPQAEHAEAEDRQNTEKPEDAGIEDYDIGQDVGLPILNVEEDLHSYNEMSDEDYRNHMQKLNKTQIAFVYDIIHHLKTSSEPIYKFLSGGAGVGKSYVTTALYQTALKYLNKKEGDNFTARKLLLLAPTGKAAYHIKGTTIHCGLKIPPNQRLEHKPLSASSLNSLRNEIGSITLIFIDEISMVGFKMMNCIHQRLMEIKQSPKPFGGVSIIAVGDLFQLKPVMDAYIFSSPRSGYLPLATNLWTELFSMVELTQIMRQADHKMFAELLNRLREGNQTQQDLDILRQRQLTISQTQKDYPSKSVHLYATNERVNAFNSTVIHRTDTPKSIVGAKDRLVGSTPPSMRQKILQNFRNSSQTKQLSNTVELAEGIIYDLTVNIDTSDGLINGASCTIKKLSLPTGETQPKGIVWVQFHDENIGRALRNSSKHLYKANINRNWTPIEPIVKQCTAGHKGQAQIQRLQYPLRPAHAKTIHRSQGDTMDSAVIDMTTKRKIEHIHYVAVSRLKSLEGLHIINLEDNKIAVSTEVQREMERLRSLPQQVSSTLALSRDDGNLKIVYLNARSFHRHLSDIKCDININASDIAIFSETRLCQRDSEDATSLPSHEHQYRFDGNCIADINRPFHGLAIYSKQAINVLHQCKYNNIEIVLSETNTGISVIGLYKPPSASSTALCKALKEVHTNYSLHESIILGDFNIDWNENSSQKKQLEKCLCHNLGYKQIIEDPTTDRQTRIDLIFSRLPQPVRTGTAEVYFSDHKIIWSSC